MHATYRNQSVLHTSTLIQTLLFLTSFDIT